ncbi:MAG: leucine-rich repeat domain-containing protein [Candidatus Heimdallarchaeota archaeon]|nr:leucine-rich repeat domain-containing protein [Candidatus Heimdallarchaeota archaeon]
MPSRLTSLHFELRLLGYSISERSLQSHFNYIDKQAVGFYFAGYELPVIPITIFRFPTLESLDLHANKITQVFDDIGVLKKLRHLDLSRNELITLPESMENLRQIEVLNLAQNEIRVITINLVNFYHLKRLNLSNNLLIEIPIGLELASNLIELDMGNNLLNDFPDLSNMHNLEVLYFNGNQLQAIPDNLATLPLKKLDISNNHLYSIPGAILSKIPSYEYFNASNNHMQSILESISDEVYENLANSFILELSNLKSSTQLFEYISEEQLLRFYLEMRLNNISFSLRKVGQIISISNNQLHINLAGLNIQYFPLSLCQFSSVHSLRMPLQLLNSLPRNIQYLSELKELKTWNSEDNIKFVLTELPTTIIRFHKLEVLDLWYNKLERLPEILSNLVHLRHLNLAYNNIKYVPDLSRMDNLEIIDFTGLTGLKVQVSDRCNVRIKL